MTPAIAMSPGRCCWLATGLLCGAAAALAETSPYILGAALDVHRDSNLYRVADGQEAFLPADRSKAETITTASLIAGLDQPFGRQRLFGSASLRSSRYANNAALNNSGYGLNLGLDWSAPERISGNFGILANQGLAQFNALSGTSVQTRKNIENTQQIDAKVRVGVVTRYTAEFGLTRRSVAYSAPEYDSGEYGQTSASLGLRYRPGGALTLGSALRMARTNYPNYFRFLADPADRFRRQDLDVTADWKPTGASDLSARLSATRTSYDRADVRNISGFTGGATWAWRPAGKLSFGLSLQRDTGQESAFANLGAAGSVIADYSRITTSAAINSVYELTSKVSVSASASTSHRGLQDAGSLSSASSTARSGNDTTNVFKLGAAWTPTRNSKVGCDLGSERRSASGGLSNALRSSSFGCSGQILVQ